MDEAEAVGPADAGRDRLGVRELVAATAGGRADPVQDVVRRQVRTRECALDRLPEPGGCLEPWVVGDALGV